MAVKRLVDLLIARESRQSSNSKVGNASPMSSGTWGVQGLGSDPRLKSTEADSGFVFGSSVWGLDSYGTKASPLAAIYGVTPEED